LGKLEKDAKIIQTQVAELAIFSEGSVSYTEIWHLSPLDRELLIQTLNKYNKMKNGNTSQDWMD